MSTLETFKLKTNPFRLTPAINSKELIWAGFANIKEELEKRIKRSIAIPNSSLVLNWGEYGSGKTHAVRYFGKKDVLSTLSGENAIPLFLDINFPKSKDPIKDIFIQIIDKIDINEIRDNMSKNDIDIPNILAELTDNSFIQSVLKVMFSKNSDLFDPTGDGERFKGFLYGTADQKKYSEKGIHRKLNGDNDYVDFLSALFSLITYHKKCYSCVVFWIDEFEDISILSSVNISNINNFIRSLIDKTPNELLMFLNLTQSAMLSVEDLSEYLQEAVKSRIKSRIEFSMPDSKALKVYLLDLLNNDIYREGSNCDYYPFSETLVDLIIQDLGNVSLRRYNEAFSLLLENAMFDNIDTITEEYYNEVKTEIIGWK